jgi:hypothetical protein
MSGFVHLRSTQPSRIFAAPPSKFGESGASAVTRRGIGSSNGQQLHRRPLRLAPREPQRRGHT